MATLAYRDSTVGADSSFANNSIAATLPTNVNGDLITICAGVFSIAPATPPDLDTPSGYTVRGSFGPFSIVGGAVNAALFWFDKISNGSEPATVTISTTGGVNAGLNYTNATYDNPKATGFFGAVAFDDAASSTTITIPANTVTTDEANCMLMAHITQGVAQTITPNQMTEREDDSASGLSRHDQVQAASGNNAAKTFTLPTAADGAWAFAWYRSEADTDTPVLLGQACL
jgi:hypothetical protein